MLANEQSVLILGDPGDLHVAAAQWWMDKRGVSVNLMPTRDFPRCAQASIRISNDDPLVFSHSTVGFSEVRTVWNRRRSAPEPRPGTHPADVSTVKQQSMLFLANLLSSIAEDAVWVNSLESQRIADQKLVSLSLAKECGFSIPDTLASNDPVRVRAFAERHGWDVIAKNFVQGGWRTADGNLVMMRTSRLDRNSLQGDGAILKCPMIFQPYIRKERELRVTVIGNQVFPFSVVCNDTETVDWRIDEAAGAVRFEPVSIPSALEQACLRLCRRVGLRFAAIDILVLADGTSLFLEVNEGGQFLWLEEACPEVPLLDTFCHLLATPITGIRSVEPLYLREFRSSTEWQERLRVLNAGGTGGGDNKIVPET